MFSNNIQNKISKIAMFLVLFATLAPSISHAFAAHRGVSLLQEICTTNGTKKIVIQTITTHGQKLETTLTKASSEKSINATLHLEHCPFCSISIENVATATNTTWMLKLAQQAKTIAFLEDVPLPNHFFKTPQPTRAPPASTLNT